MPFATQTKHVVSRFTSNRFVARFYHFTLLFMGWQRFNFWNFVLFGVIRGNQHQIYAPMHNSKYLKWFIDESTTLWQNLKPIL